MENQNQKIDTSKIERELQQVEKERETLKEKIRILEAFRSYDGDDRVISSKEFLEEFEDRKVVDSIKTGIPKLDDLTEGFREGNLIIISGVTGAGKTSLAQTFLSNFVKNDISSLFFTFEVPPEELLNKFGDKVPLFYLPRQHKRSKMQWLEERILESKAKYGVKVVFIDHLHYLLDMDQLARQGNTSLMIGSIMRELKRIAIENKLIIFLIAHFKKVKLEEDEMPDIDGLRDSSFVGQEGDYVMIINRKKDINRENWIDEATLFLVKNRWNGRTGAVQLKYSDNHFLELDTIHEEEQYE